VPGSILQRYVLLELLRVFALALTAITGILVMAGIVAEASQQGLGPLQILKLLPLLVPETLPYTIPATTLFAVSVVFGRMANDNEITAIKAAGVPITHVLWPAFVLGAAVSGGVLALYDTFIPHCHHQLRTTALKDVEELIYARLRRDLCFNEMKVNYAIFVREVQGRRLLGATFKRRDAKGNDDVIAMAKEAEIHVDMPNQNVIVEMLHGEISKDGGNTYYIFEKEILPVPMPPIGSNRQVRARERSNAEILGHIDEVHEAMAAKHAEIDRLKAQPVPVTEEEKKAYKSWTVPAAQLVYDRKDLNEHRTEYATRPALALGCLFFVLVGCPVAIWFQKRDYLSAFVTCFLPIVVVYYPLVMFGINLGKDGRVNPHLVLWLGNGVMGTVGLGLLYQLARR
jgi:lipopolysaccharide export system permease protein